MSGMEQMMKAFGIDPVAIKKNMEAFQGLVVDLAGALGRIEANQRLIAAKLGVELPNAPTGLGHTGESGHVGTTLDGVGKSPGSATGNSDSNGRAG